MGRLLTGLAERRERLGWTQAEAGEAGGVSRQSYAAIESGASVPSTEVALRLARAMGMAVEELFRLPEEPSETLTARWTGQGRPAGRRVRLARVAGEHLACPAGDDPGSEADGVVIGGSSYGSTSVRVRLLDDRPRPVDLVAVGCDPAFGIVASVLRRRQEMEVVWSRRGSRASLEALARGEAHVAGAHLHDPGTGDSNERWIRELVPFPCTRIAFAVWEEGLLVRPGNPDGIVTVADLARSGLRLVNREEGSGSRLLLDRELEAAGVEPERVGGYGTAARGHMAVGEAVAAGLADAGVGIRAAGARFGLDVIPLQTERYELVVPDHFLDLPAVSALLDALRTPGIGSQVEALPGYDASDMGTPR